MTHTNKADLYALPDGSVVKRYFTENKDVRAEQDERSLAAINALFGPVQSDGWTYRIVKTIWVDAERGMVCMEMAPGEVLAELPRLDLKQAEHHAGVWLAFYHNRMLRGELEGPIFTDYSVGNLLVNLDQKTVVGIDPGMAWRYRGCAYEDLVKHIHSVIVGLILRRGASPLLILSFVRGYASSASAKPCVTTYYVGLRRELSRLFADYRKKSKARAAAFPLLVIASLPIYLFVVPVCLLLTKRRSAVPNGPEPPSPASLQKNGEHVR